MRAGCRRVFPTDGPPPGSVNVDFSAYIQARQTAAPPIVLEQALVRHGGCGHQTHAAADGLARNARSKWWMVLRFNWADTQANQKTFSANRACKSPAAAFPVLKLAVLFLPSIVARSLQLRLGQSAIITILPPGAPSSWQHLKKGDILLGDRRLWANLPPWPLSFKGERRCGGPGLHSRRKVDFFFPHGPAAWAPTGWVVCLEQMPSSNLIFWNGQTMARCLPAERINVRIHSRIHRAIFAATVAAASPCHDASWIPSSIPRRQIIDSLCPPLAVNKLVSARPSRRCWA